ncbi:MAG: ATP-binding cassette domain-containing protein [Desulfobacterales bacterium]|nr:ATP-binding cassette domain-containing protein [Desulfobacterales bacterium]
MTQGKTKITPPGDIPEMIRIDNLHFAYADRAPVFDGFNLKVNPGEAWSVIGPSGCGKTTLLYLLAGLRAPDRGEIRVGGAPIRQPRPETGLVLQDHGLLPWATVEKNVRLGLDIRKFYGADGRHAPSDFRIDPRSARKIVQYWLQRMGIETLKDRHPSQLSGGQRQRTAIARTLALEPDLLLLDEPFSALDAPTSEDLQRLIIELHRESGITLVIVTHDIEVAVGMGKKILLLTAERNTAPRVIENDCAGGAARRHDPMFRDRCEELRALLGDLS